MSANDSFNGVTVRLKLEQFGFKDRRAVVKRLEPLRKQKFNVLTFLTDEDVTQSCNAVPISLRYRVCRRLSKNGQLG